MSMVKTTRETKETEVIDLTGSSPIVNVSINSSSSSSSSSSDSSSSSSSSSSASSSLNNTATTNNGPTIKQAPPIHTVSTVATSSSSRGPTVLVNPYKKKFVGGAEAARQKARKKPKATRIVSPLERERCHQVLSTHMGSMERFGAALLRSSATEFWTSERGSSHSDVVWTHICQRVSLPVPTEPVRARYRDAASHFAVRAALVLEEARCAIAQPLTRLWGPQGQAMRKNSGSSNNSNNSNNSMIWTAHYSEKNSHGHVKVNFLKQHQPFTKDELFHLRPGTIFQCVPRDSPRRLQDTLLGLCCSSVWQRGSDATNKRECSLLLFRDVPGRLEEVEFVVTPLCTLISELRCFEACTGNLAHHVAFGNDLLGQKRATYITYDDDGNEVEQEFSQSVPPKETKQAATLSDFLGPSRGLTKNGPFALARLNRTQEKAADTFLSSSKGTITLIQGPPGTGKTTLLVNIICRYLLEPQNAKDKRCLLVCAPTNKAITVLATRFMKAMNLDKSRFNALMVGDADKLLAEERNNQENLGFSASLKAIFVFSWVQAVVDDYRTIRKHFSPPRGFTNAQQTRKYTIAELYQLSQRVEQRLQSNLPGIPKNLLREAARATHSLRRIHEGEMADVVSILNPLIKQFDEMSKQPGDFIYRQLISNADVIFCTLASAGGMVLKGHQVDDLIVDEAAAATEPEMYIPFHLQPKRMLCVGDPLQLPATVLSRRAVELGLSESLHERLMYRCNQDYVMLDVQYRMNPAISSFPSLQFYDSKINNGENVQSPSHVGSAVLLDGEPYTFLQVEGVEEQSFGGSIKNTTEARCVVDLVLQLRNSAAHLDDHWYASSKIRIITFYQAQVALLKKLFREHGLVDQVVVATVDSSQGCEADIVLVSFVRSNAYSAGFLTDNRRLNVALTRAKFQLIGVGNVSQLSQMPNAPTLQELANNALRRKVVQPLGYTGNQNNRSAVVKEQLDIFYGSSS